MSGRKCSPGAERTLDLARTLVEVIDARSFTNAWYWMVVAVFWSTLSHYVLGVPFDMIARARRSSDQALADLTRLVDINVRRILYISRVSGLILIALWAFVLSGLVLLGFWYWIELAQAISFLAVPATLIGVMTMRSARIIDRDRPEGQDLIRRLLRHRFWTHVTGMISIFITAMFGMYHNLSVVPGF